MPSSSKEAAGHEETGLYHYRARTYDPEKGRFLQRDPLGPACGCGLYEYCDSAPCVMIDPSGMTGLTKEQLDQLTPEERERFDKWQRSLDEAWASTPATDEEMQKEYDRLMKYRNGWEKAACGAIDVVNEALDFANEWLRFLNPASLITRLLFWLFKQFATEFYDNLMGVLADVLAEVDKGTAAVAGAIAKGAGVGTSISKRLARLLNAMIAMIGLSAAKQYMTAAGGGGNQKSKPTSLPKVGKPGSVVTKPHPSGDPKQVREYGPGGEPKTDVDHGHGHEKGADGKPVGSPHAHDWEDGVRGPARPVKPADPKPN